MLQSAYYESDLAAFCQASENEVLGELTAQHHFALENQQRHAWQQQISILKASLIGVAAGRIYFEFAIPRMGKRADVVVLIAGVVFVIEFKVGSATFDQAALEQVPGPVLITTQHLTICFPVGYLNWSLRRPFDCLQRRINRTIQINWK